MEHQSNSEKVLASSEEFVRLRTSNQPEEYARAASASAPVEVWLDVIERFPELRVWVAHNKTVPNEILNLLARDEDVSVRLVVAMKKKLPSDLFVLLASDGDVGVRQRIAYNKKTPRAVLEILSTDSVELVAEPARNRLAIPSGSHKS